ncbi:MAG: hypothetical protein IJX78_01070 [Bacilli bacterium]|nr:hypothetical protein [Bacilli bacterium]
MRVNVSNLSSLIDKKYRGNQSFFAEEAEIDRCYLNQLLNGKIDSNSPKICNKIIRYCEKNNLNYKDFIFLE